MQRIDSKRPSRSLATGLILIILLTAVTAGAGLYATNRVGKQADYIIQDQRNRLDLLYSLRNIVHERILLMTWTLLDTDPFRRDEYYAKFLELGNRFIEVRVQIDGMQMSQEEMLAMTKFREQTTLIGPMVDETFHYMVEQRSVRDREKLVERVVPAQENILTGIDRVISRVQTNHEALVIQTHNTYRQTLLLFSAMSVAIIIATAFIGWRMMLRFRSGQTK